MGLFGSTNKYAKEEKQLSVEHIRQLVSRSKVCSLDFGEESLVEKEIVKRRHGDGKISLAQIYEVLTKLKNQNKISQFDRNGLMKIFEEYFTNKFGN